MTQADKIKAQYEKYQSGHKPTDEEIERVIANNEECCQCGKSIYQMDDFPVIREELLYCEDCEMQEFYQTCPICENSYEKPQIPTEDYLIISKESVERYRISAKPGFYQVLKYPYFYGDCLTGFDDVFPDSIKLIRELDINSMLKRIHPHSTHDKVSADSCCYDCVMKYTGQSKIVNNYYDKAYGKKQVALIKQAIKDGK